MKILKKALALLLGMCMCVGIISYVAPDVSAQAKVKNSKVQKTLKKEITNKFCKYAFFDMDKDGLDELISLSYDATFNSSGYDSGQWLTIYKYNNGKSETILSERVPENEVGYIAADFYYSNSFYAAVNIICTEKTYSKYYKMSSGTFGILCEKEDFTDEKTKDIYYDAKHNSTTLKKYNKLLKKFPSDKSKTDIKMKQPGKKQVNKYIRECLMAYAKGFRSKLKVPEALVEYIYEDEDENGVSELRFKLSSGDSYILSTDTEPYYLGISVKKEISEKKKAAITDYVEENYPDLLELTDNGLISFSGEFAKDTIKLGKWDLEYAESSKGSIDKLVLATDGEKEDIEWEVLGYSPDGTSAYLISKYILFNKQFNDELSKPNFAGSSLSAWLNDEFYKNAFTEEEKALIKDTSTNNRALKVSMLNTGGVDYYYPGYKRTEAVYERIGSYIDGTPGRWWTRTDGLKYNYDYESYSSTANIKVTVLPDGSIDDKRNWLDEEENIGRSLTGNIGVRPFMEISLTKEIIEENNLSIGNSLPKLEKVYVVLGEYESSYSTGKEPVEWEILDYNVEKGEVLLLSRYLQKVIAYDASDESEEGSEKVEKVVTWENCSLRKYLNENFYDETFSDEEKNMIKTVSLSNEDNSKYNTKGGNDTEDNVFVLSYSDIKKYFPSNTSGFVKDLICSFSNGSVRSWWLRTPGSKSSVEGFEDYSSKAVFVGSLGDVILKGEPVTEGEVLKDDSSYDFSPSENAVRPAIVLSLN